MAVNSLNSKLKTKEIAVMGNTSPGVLLKEIGFKYKRDGMERTNIFCFRACFLRTLEKL